MNKKIRALIIITATLLILALILIQSGTFSRGKITPGEITAVKPTVRGDIFSLKKTEVPVIYCSVGTVRSRDEIALAPRIVARVREVTRRSGDSIKKGELLVKLDDADLKAARDRAAENLTAAEAALERSEKDYVRQKGLMEKNVIPRKTFEVAEEDWRASSARVNSIRQSLKEADTNFAYAEVVSPMDSIVAERFVDPGDMAGPTNVMLRVFDPSRLMLYVPLRESLVKSVVVGDKIMFTVDAVGKDYTGEIREIVPAVDSGSRTFMIKMCILGDTQGLMPGMFGTIELKLGTEPAYIVPAAAITLIGQLEYLTVVNADGSVAKRLVRTGPGATRGTMRIVSGIDGDTSIVIPGTL